MGCSLVSLVPIWPQPHPPAKKTDYCKWPVIGTKNPSTGLLPTRRARNPVSRHRDLLLFHLPRSSQSTPYSKSTKLPKTLKALRLVRQSMTGIYLSLRMLNSGRSLKSSGRATTRFSKNLRELERSVILTRTKCLSLEGQQTSVLSLAIGL